MANFTNPPTWTASASCVASQTEVTASVGHTGFYYLCTNSGTSASVPPTWASVFGTTITDGSVIWTCVQRQRNAWASKIQYTSGLPVVTVGTVLNNSASATAIAGGAQFIPIGAYIIGGTIPAADTIIAVTAASTAVLATPVGTGFTGQTLTFNSFPYPWPDQIITNASVGAPVVQCIATGTSGSVQPAWSASIGTITFDGSVTWMTVANN